MGRWVVSQKAKLIWDTLYHSSGMGSHSHVKETGMLINKQETNLGLAIFLCDSAFTFMGKNIEVLSWTT